MPTLTIPSTSMLIITEANIKYLPGPRGSLQTVLSCRYTEATVPLTASGIRDEFNIIYIQQGDCHIPLCLATKIGLLMAYDIKTNAPYLPALTLLYHIAPIGPPRSMRAKLVPSAVKLSK